MRYIRQTPIKLNFFTTTLTLYTNQSALNTLQIKYTPDALYEIIVVSLLTMSVIFTIWIFRRLRQKVAYKFDLYLYVGSNEHFCSICIRSFVLEPSVYTFSAATYIQNLNIHGCFLQYLTMMWPSLQIHSTVTNEDYEIPKSIQVSWLQKRHLSRLLTKPYWCILVGDYTGHRSIIQLSRWESAPAYEGQPINQMVVPTTSNIYPKLN